MKSEKIILIENKISTTTHTLHFLITVEYPRKSEIDFLIRDAIKDAYFMGVEDGTK